MSRKHYQQIAETIALIQSPTERALISERLCEILHAANPAFQPVKFCIAVEQAAAPAQ